MLGFGMCLANVSRGLQAASAALPASELPEDAASPVAAYG